MIKAQRNDRDELEEFEKDFIEVDELESSKGRYLVLVVVLALFGLVYFGGVRRSTFEASELDDAPAKDKRRGRREETASTDKVSTQKPTVESSKQKEGTTGRDAPPEDQAEDADQKQGGGKKKGKKK